MVEEKNSMEGTLALDLEQKRRIQKLGCLVFIKVKPVSIFQLNSPR